MGEEKIKCVVWDLDNTIWDGILSEDKEIHIKDGVVDIIKELDRRGILQSISSKNDFHAGKEALEKLGLWEYFIYPEINWNGKSQAVGNIAKSINIGINTLAFVDDQEFEREEVQFTHPEVMCIDAADMYKILDMDRMMPNYVTTDSKNRRKLYQSDIVRNQLEEKFTGTKEEFLRTLGMKLTLSCGEEGDLQRMEELTVRTHQLNSTGYVYSYDELKGFIDSDNYDLLVAQMEDKYGDYGKIGLALIEKQKDCWELKLLLMSCRVMAKGVGNIFMNTILNRAREHKVAFRAQFVPTDRNRIMYITYKFNGFKEVSEQEGIVMLEADMSYERSIPDYVTLIVKEENK